MHLKELFLELTNEMKKSLTNLPKFKYPFVISAYNNLKNNMQANLKENEKITKNKIKNLLTDNIITQKMYEKILNILENKEEKNDDKNHFISLLNELIKIPGIGYDKALKLIELNVRNIKDLKLKKFFDLLPKNAKTYVTNDKVLDKISKKYIQELEKIFQEMMKKINNKTELYVLGSYSRKLPFSKDIDVLMISDDKNMTDLFLDHLSENKMEYKILTKGEKKSSIYLNHNDNKLHIDIFNSSYEHKIPMIFYLTGNKNFNIYMRKEFSKQDMKLNQYGLFDKKTGKEIKINNEKDYFDILKIDYIEPKNRTFIT